MKGITGFIIILGGVIILILMGFLSMLVRSGRKQEKTLYRHMILADVLNLSFERDQEQLDYVLHEALKLTESEYGYIYLYDEEKQEFMLNSWTRGVMEACEVADKQTKYQLDKTGIWGEVVRQGKPIIINDFNKPHPLHPFSSRRRGRGLRCLG